MTEQVSVQIHATLLDLVKSNDPYPHPCNPLVHPRDNVRMTSLHLILADYHLDPPILPVGHIHPAILADMIAYNIETKGDSFAFYPIMGPRADDVNLGTIKAVAFKNQAVEKGQDGLTRIVDCFVEFMRKRGTIPDDKFGPGEDRFALYASSGSTYFSGKEPEFMGNSVATVARSRSGFFGIATFGVAAILYEGVGAEMKIWIQVRGKTLDTWGGKLDVSAGGALAAGMSPLEGIVRECSEEAELPEDFCRSMLKYTSSSSYWMTAKEWVRPHNVFTFEAELEVGISRPKVPAEYMDECPEVDGYLLMTPTEVKTALLQARFQPHAAICLIGFLDRHGFLTDKSMR